MLRIAVCDSTENFRHQISSHIRQFLSEHKTNGVVSLYVSASSFLKSTCRYQALFISRSEFITLEESAREQPFLALKDTRIVILTSSIDATFISGKTNVYAYLLLPTTVQKLEPVLTKLFQEHLPEKRHYLLLRQKTYPVKIYLEDIVYMELFNRKLKIWKWKEYIEVRAQIKDIERLLDHRFFRIHEGYLINLDFFVSIHKDKNSYDVTMENGIRLPMSRLKKNALLQALQEKAKRDPQGQLLCPRE